MYPLPSITYMDRSHTTSGMTYYPLALNSHHVHDALHRGSVGCGVDGCIHPKVHDVLHHAVRGGDTRRSVMQLHLLLRWIDTTPRVGWCTIRCLLNSQRVDDVGLRGECWECVV